MKIENKHISQAAPKASPSAKESSAKKDMEQVKLTPLSPSKDTSLENKSTQKHANTKVNESLPVQSKASPVQQVMFSSDSEGDKPKALPAGISQLAINYQEERSRASIFGRLFRNLYPGQRDGDAFKNSIVDSCNGVDRK